MDAQRFEVYWQYRCAFASLPDVRIRLEDALATGYVWVHMEGYGHRHSAVIDPGNVRVNPLFARHDATKFAPHYRREVANRVLVKIKADIGPAMAKLGQGAAAAAEAMASMQRANARARRTP